ncbi:RidA family protein [Shewanella eurypsychrophilus]|uniref:RidA family protein n=1 Tax=Shewanella eurypsychrophilus TaxID=2593656 RepID=A0ABX6V5S1_9GAMM|nr:MULTISPECIES: RidA family protein [Shewanella]QFU22400.1 RidA family protein [Shewanella sp. YLB-09]QPG57687.1 RidA family protein [Shewanella eurypsychrophilus]
MNVQRINYAELGEIAGPYVHASIHKHTLYTSGLTAFGTQAQTGNIGEQTRAIFSQLSLIATHHNITLKSLVKVTLFVTDLTDIVLLRQTLFDIYGDDLPASSLIKVDALFCDDLKIEIEAILGL